MSARLSSRDDDLETCAICEGPSMLSGRGEHLDEA